MNGRSLERLIVRLACYWLLIAMPVFGQMPSKSHFQKHWWDFSKLAKQTPAEQLSYANHLKSTGNVRKAACQYRALASKWPQSVEAPTALFNYAQYLTENGKLIKAFDEFQYLTEVYSGFFPYQEVFNYQSKIANQLATQKRRFFFFTYCTPEEAIPYFQKLIINAPHYEKTAELQFRISEIYEQQKSFELAIASYETYLHKYPSGLSSEQAYFHLATCYLALARKTPSAIALKQYSIAAFRSFLERYPLSDMAEFAQTYIHKLQEEQSRLYYQQARFYEKSAWHTRNKKHFQERLAAARIMYQRLINEFPVSWWVDAAHSRIVRIEEKLEKYNES